MNTEFIITKLKESITRVTLSGQSLLFVTIYKNAEAQNLFQLSPSWDENSKDCIGNAAIAVAIGMIETEYAKRSQPKPLAAKEAFEQIFIQDKGSLWVKNVGYFETAVNDTMLGVIMRATELYVTSQIEHLKKELQK
jgi:hypothetical protein